VEIRDYIEEAQKNYGTLIEVATKIGVRPQHLSNAKSGQRGLPVYACIKLAGLLAIEPMEVIAASELVTETHEDRIEIFRPFVQAARLVQHLMIAGFTVMTAAAIAVENFSVISQSFLLKRLFSMFRVSVG
jgi:hypothetical protein